VFYHACQSAVGHIYLFCNWRYINNLRTYLLTYRSIGVFECSRSSTYTRVSVAVLQVKSRTSVAMPDALVVSPTVPIARSTRTSTPATNRTPVATTAATNPTHTPHLSGSTPSCIPSGLLPVDSRYRERVPRSTYGYRTYFYMNGDGKSNGLCKSNLADWTRKSDLHDLELWFSVRQWIALSTFTRVENSR